MRYVSMNKSSFCYVLHVSTLYVYICNRILLNTQSKISHFAITYLNKCQHCKIIIYWAVVNLLIPDK